MMMTVREDVMHSFFCLSSFYVLYNLHMFVRFFTKNIDDGDGDDRERSTMMAVPK